MGALRPRSGAAGRAAAVEPLQRRRYASIGELSISGLFGVQLATLSVTSAGCPDRYGVFEAVGSRHADLSVLMQHWPAEAACPDRRSGLHVLRLHDFVA